MMKTPVKKTNKNTSTIEDLEKQIERGFIKIEPNIASGYQPNSGLVDKLANIAASLERLSSHVETLMAIFACQHATKITAGIKSCPFCEVSIGNSKLNQK